MDGGHPIIDIVLPTFRMEPEEHERLVKLSLFIFETKSSFKTRFYPSKAKQIAERIISEELNGTVYEEEDAKNWSLNISDKVREAVCGQ